MRKLSEIPMDEYICVGDIETGIMTKGDYLESSYFRDREDVTVCEADARPVGFNWDDILEYLGQEQHESWEGDNLTTILANEKLVEAATIVNGIFQTNPTYWEGEPIEIDMLPPEGVHP